MPDKQAGYMTATEFRIASALRPLHAGGVHICLAKRDGFEPEGRLFTSLDVAAGRCKDRTNSLRTRLIWSLPPSRRQDAISLGLANL
jgi:hypothetical protein